MGQIERRITKLEREQTPDGEAKITEIWIVPMDGDPEDDYLYWKATTEDSLEPQS